MEKDQEKQKVQYSVKIDATIPLVVNYKVWAYSPEEAVEMARKLTNQYLSGPPTLEWRSLRRLKATVYTAGTLLVQLVKTLG